MHSFRKKVTIAEDFSPEFYLNHIYAANGVRYHVSVKGSDRRFHFFVMECRKGVWKIIDSADLPRWVFVAEKELATAIAWNLSNVTDPSDLADPAY